MPVLLHLCSCLRNHIYIHHLFLCLFLLVHLNFKHTPKTALPCHEMYDLNAPNAAF